MEKKIAVIDIIYENSVSIESLNNIFHDFRDYVIGRMGLPYRVKNVSIMSVAIEADQETISAITDTIKALEGVDMKIYYLGSPQ